MRLLTSAFCLLTSAFLTASQTPPQFRAGVELIHVDVSVLDRDRRPVKGLTSADFTILEDGRPQAIAAFAAVELPDAEEPTAAWMRTAAPDIQRNDQLADRRLFVIVMDDATIQSNPAALKSAKEIAARFIDRLGPSDLATVVFTRDNRNAQEFTSDHRRLVAAVDRLSLGFRDTGVERSALADWVIYFRASVETLATVAEYLIEVPQRRKALVYIGQGEIGRAHV